MIPVVKSLEEAKEFFLNNSSGSCLGIKGEIKKELNSYPEAKEFFKTN